MSLLAAHGLHVAYGDHLALDGVDLEVAPGDLLAVIGPNGAGKTTLLRALAGVVSPTRGEVLLEGRPLSSLSRVEVARRLAVVSQEPQPVEGFTVFEIAAMGRAPHQGRWMRASPEDDDIVDASLARCGVSHLSGRAFGTLSGGERKRVLVAQALTQRPAVLLLDEPSAFLDLKHGIDLFAVLREETARGLAVVAVLHDLSLVARYAERVAILVAGRLSAPGPVDEVTRPERLREAFGVEVERFVSADGRVRGFGF